DYHLHALEIYKLYVDLTDKLSVRRLSVNSFFLTLNSFIIGLLGYGKIATPQTITTPEFYWIISILGMIICIIWFRIIRSYKNILRARFLVIQGIEQELPLAPYAAEWQFLQADKAYRPLTHFEMWVPWIFFVLNIAISLKATFM
ncbi:MAG: hypothetical protein KAH77_03995, partial [Thiomargarita sp.]|nr:hypothetical protein [Thiomargarita sp.]